MALLSSYKHIKFQLYRIQYGAKLRQPIFSDIKLRIFAVRQTRALFRYIDKYHVNDKKKIIRRIPYSSSASTRRGVLWAFNTFSNPDIISVISGVVEMAVVT
jgi:hypothetical protein